jgi:hypothetical protein
MTLSNLMSAACGAGVAVALLLACSDDSPSVADAADGAACDCPSAEPPLAGRLVRVRGEVQLGPLSSDVASAGCPFGATVVSGDCSLLPGPRRNTVLGQSLAVIGDGESWRCGWDNQNDETLTGVATALCLVPAAP